MGPDHVSYCSVISQQNISQCKKHGNEKYRQQISHTTCHHHRGILTLTEFAWIQLNSIQQFIQIQVVPKNMIHIHTYTKSMLVLHHYIWSRYAVRPPSKPGKPVVILHPHGTTGHYRKYIKFKGSLQTTNAMGKKTLQKSLCCVDKNTIYSWKCIWIYHRWNGGHFDWGDEFNLIWLHGKQMCGRMIMRSAKYYSFTIIIGVRERSCMLNYSRNDFECCCY